MLVDTVDITIKAGNGGNGRVSFRHLPGNYKGGPDGGNGGKGGDVYFVGVDDILALADFRYKKELHAQDGEPGANKNLFGKNGSDVTIQIPIGTLVTDTQTGETFEIQNTTPFLVAKGGIGGKGNNEFKTATNQTPRFAQKGTLGELRHLHLELKLIADIGLIGLPNAGKSSLLAVLTNAHPKIGNYPFTTLEPNIGMMGPLALADIPGLIEGAHTGRGLGIEFLRHIEKTKLLLHCVSCENDNAYESYQIVRKELEEYNKRLGEKNEIIALTKTDLFDESTIKEKVKQLKKTKKQILLLSLYDKESITQLTKALQKI